MTKTRWLLIWYVVQDNKVNVQSNVGAFNNGINCCDPKLLSLKHHLGCNCQHTTCDSIQTFYCLTDSVSRHSKYITVKREKIEKNRMYLVPLFVWSVSQFPSGLHICQAWHWSCRCHWSWRKWAQRALRCICSLAHGCASHCSAWD